MNIFRSGHGASSYASGTIAVFGGQGRPLPKNDSNIQSQRLSTILNFQYNNVSPQAASPEDICTETTMIYDVEPTACHLTIKHHVPAPREFMSFSPLDNVCFPQIFQSYIDKNKNSEINNESNSNNISVLFGGRQSPVIVYNDLWLFIHNINLWVEIVSYNRIIFNNQSSSNEQSTNNNTALIFSLSTPKKTSNAEHLILIAVLNNSIYIVKKTPSNSHNNQLSTFSITSSAFLSIEEAISFSQSLTAKELPDTTKTVSSASSISSSQYDVSSSPSWPMARFKSASDTINGLFCVHGGRGGFCLPLSVVQQPLKNNDTANLHLSSNIIASQLNLPNLQTEHDVTVQDGFIIDSVINISIKPIKNTSTKENVVNGSTISNINEQNDDTTVSNNEGLYYTTLMNDLWCVDFTTFPFIWKRLDTLCNNTNNDDIISISYNDNKDNSSILPSSRFSHSGTLLPLTHQQYFDFYQQQVNVDQNNSIISQPTLQQDNKKIITFFVFGGLYLSKKLFSNNLSSINTLFPSSTLFAFNITELLAKSKNQEGKASSSFSLPLCLATQPLLSPTQYCLSVNEHTQYQRPLDVFGHQLCGVMHQNIPLLICIGGHSNADPSQCAIQVLHFDTASSSSSSSVDQIYKPFCWYDVIEMHEAIFSQFAATKLSGQFQLPSSVITYLKNKDKNYDAPIDVDHIDEKNQIISNQYDCITLLGGGALCFSFGKFYNPSTTLYIPTNGSISECINNMLLVPYNIQLNVSPLQQQQLNKVLGIKKEPKTQYRNPNKAKKEDKTQNDTPGVTQQCIICQKVFPSKNKLFHHISITGHTKQNSDNKQ